MKTLFGMQIFPERRQLTDDEVVAKVREFLAKYDGRRKWLLGVPVILALSTMLMIAWLIHMGAQMAPFLKGVPGAAEIWFLFGLFLGWMAGHLLTAAVHSFAVAVSNTFEMRTRRLLVRYFDACQALDAEAVADEMGPEGVP